MRNSMLPTAFLNLQEQGATGGLGAQRKRSTTATRMLVILKPKTGAPVRRYVRRRNRFLPVRVIVKINLPQIGEVEQTTDLSDFRDVDGVKVPLAIIASSAIQRSRHPAITKVEHNTKVDEALFSKPGGQD